MKREKVTYLVDADQAAALRQEALRRATERGVMKPDASEVLREAVGEWLKRHRR